MSEVKVNKISPRTGTDIELNSTAKITNFTSTGIDDNASSTAVTIDSSNRLLVGKTSAGTSTVGAELRDTGLVTGTVDGSHCGNFNRLSSDGEVIRIQRDGTTVGKIEGNSSGISIYLGGTGSANALDDYETGTWTPEFTGETSTGSYSYSFQNGYYTKIGNTVHASFRLINITDVSAGSGNVIITGLPFTKANDGIPNHQSVYMTYFTTSGDSDWQLTVDANTTDLRIRRMNSGSGVTLQVSDKVNNLADIYTLITYRV